MLFGRNSEDLKVPYQPFIEVIRQAIAQHDGSIEVPDGLAVLFPESGSPRCSRRPGRGDSTVDSETRRYRLYEAIAEWLTDARGVVR